MAIELVRRKCSECLPGSSALGESAADMLLIEVPGWKREDRVIARSFEFKNHHEAIAFVNAVAWISHRENHHPDMNVGYNRVTVSYSTHSANGLTENDFICAAKVSALAC